MKKKFKGRLQARGSGIGLAVCEEIVTMHGGTDIANAEGGGAVVTIRPPLQSNRKETHGKKNNSSRRKNLKTMIGGQALIEGIMMLGPEKSAVVVRTKDGLQRKVEPRKPLAEVVAEEAAVHPRHL